MNLAEVDGLHPDVFKAFNELFKNYHILMLHFISKDRMVAIPNDFERLSKHGNFSRGLELLRREKIWSINPIFVHLSNDGIIEELLSGRDTDWEYFGDAQEQNGLAILRHGITAMNISEFSQSLDLQYSATGARLKLSQKGISQLDSWVIDRFGKS